MHTNQLEAEKSDMKLDHNECINSIYGGSLFKP